MKNVGLAGPLKNCESKGAHTADTRLLTWAWTSGSMLISPAVVFYAAVGKLKVKGGVAASSLCRLVISFPEMQHVDQSAGCRSFVRLINLV